MCPKENIRWYNKNISIHQILIPSFSRKLKRHGVGLFRLQKYNKDEYQLFNFYISCANAMYD